MATGSHTGNARQSEFTDCVINNCNKWQNLDNIGMTQVKQQWNFTRQTSMIFRFNPRFCRNFTLTNKFHHHLNSTKHANSDDNTTDNGESVHHHNHHQAFAVHLLHYEHRLNVEKSRMPLESLNTLNSILKYYSSKKLAKKTIAWNVICHLNLL